ncbi:MAG: ChbG/HpnK family deacetylase [Rhizobacter sp.]|nr:ChbG/HpnK family deacetylase [Ferruginibacter sp.]
MKKIIIALALIAPCLFAMAQEPPRLIIRADDMGYSHSGNIALIESVQKGITQSIEVIVPSPWFPEAVKMLKDNPGVDAGIHLALTSEWDNIKWRPLTDCNTLKDSNGFFFPMVYANKYYPGQAILENNWSLADVEKEFRAQIEMALKHIPRLSHISGHMGCTSMTAEVTTLTNRLAEEYGLLSENHLIPAVMGFGNSKTLAESINHFIDWLSKLENGKSYIFLDHPGIDNEELQAVHHIGYENVAWDRQRVTDVFTSEKVKAFIKEKKIRLISYKDVSRTASSNNGNFKKDPSYFVQSEKQIETEEIGPHKGGGSTTAYRFFQDIEGSKLQLTKRILQPGAAIGYHHQAKEEIYYILSGTGEMNMNGKKFPVKAGDAVITMPGNYHGLVQTGKAALVLIINYEKR